MRQTILRRGAIAVFGLAALLFATLGTVPSDTASAQAIYPTYSYVNYSYAGYPTAYYPSYTNYPVNYGYNYGYAPVYSNVYTPVYNYAYTQVNYGYSGYNGFNGYGYGYNYGVPNRFFTSVGCAVGNYTCLRANR